MIAMNYERPELLSHLAAAYAMHTLSPLARKRFERIMRGSGAARHALAKAEAKLAGLSASIEPVKPPALVWRAIEQRVAPPLREKSAVSAPVQMQKTVVRWWETLNFWRGATAFAASVALAFVLSPLLISGSGHSGGDIDGMPASYIGVMADQSGATRVVTTVRRKEKVLHVKLTMPLDVPADRRAVLWAIPAEGAPFSVGVLSATQGKSNIAMADTAENLLSKVSKLGITYESNFASVTTPTTPYVFSGFCGKLW
jgi:anti-sigma-K factor RskA